MARFLPALFLLALSACTGEDTGGPLDQDEDGSPAGEDCDDLDPTRAPGLAERCDGVDEDCDGDVDEDAADVITWYADVDGDGYGADDGAFTACVAPDGRVSVGGDCADDDPFVAPDVIESCDGVDEDCDGTVDDDAVDALAWYVDTDGDGYGDDATASVECGPVDGAVTTGGDCDEANAGVHPGAAEVCDGVDTDCDGSLDAGATDGEWWWTDADGDGFGDPDADPELDCTADGRAPNRFDCDDTDASVSPASGCAPVGEVDAGIAALSLDGLAEDDAFGSAVLLADLTGDGVAELVVGAPEANGGTIYAFDGPLSGAEHTSAPYGRRYGIDGEAFGSALAAGDLDGDGVADLVVGGPDEDTNGSLGGAVWLFSGLPTGVTTNAGRVMVYSEGPRDGVGSSLFAGADFDGDGANDLVVGGPDFSTAGRVYLIPGPLTATVDMKTAPPALILGSRSANDAGGSSVSGGDLDGDGLDELLIGAPGADEAYVVPTGSTGTLSLSTLPTLMGPGGNSLAGTSVAVIPDVDGDGLSDIAVGAPEWSGGLGGHPGITYVVVGAVTTDLDLETAAWATLEGEQADDRLGTSLAAGDFDGDGAMDLAMGAASLDYGGAEAGGVYVVRGLTSGALSMADADALIVGHVGGLLMGGSLSAADADGDGRAELAVGGVGETVGGDGAGGAWVFAGAAE